MTDELTIQQQKSKVLPYAATGVVAGGAIGGVGLPKWTTKKVTPQDLVNEQTAKDRFEKAEDFETLEKARDDVKKAEEALADASKAKIDPNLPEARELKAAQEAYNRAAGTVTGEAISGFPKGSEIPEFKTVQTKNPASLNAVWAEGKKAGKSMTGTELENTYNRLRNTIITQEKAMETAVTPLETKKTARIKDLKTLASAYESATNTLTEEQLTQFYTKEMRDPSTWVMKHTPQYSLARDIALKECGNPASINISTLKSNPELRDALLSISHPKERGEKIDFKNQDTARIKNAEGKWQEVVFNKDEALNVIKEEQQKLEERVNTVSDEIFTKMKDSIDIQRRLDPKNLSAEIELAENNIINEGVLTKSGFYDASKGKVDVKGLMESKTVTLGNVQSVKSDRISDVKAFKAMKLAPDQVVDPATLAKYGIKGKGVTAGEVEATLNARVKALKAIETHINGLNKESNALFEEISTVKEVSEQIADRKANFESLTKAREAFVRQFGDVEVKVTENGTTRTVKISELANESTSVEKEVSQAIKDRLAKAEEAYKALAEKSGKVDEKAKEVAEKGVTEAKNKALKLAEEMIGRVKNKPGMKAGAGIAAGAGALGLLAALVAPKGKNS